jgi:hypothetical protein
MYPLLKKPDQPQISDTDAWKDDPFDRKRDAEMLSRLIASSIADPLVLSLQAPWGSGKTTFLKRLQVHIKHEFAIPSISIDAWKNDESQDPLVTIISEIKLSLEKKASRAKDNVMKNAIGNTITSMAQHGAKLFLPTVAVAAEFIMPGAGAGAVAAGAGDLGERLLDAQDEKRKAEPSFREALTEARDLLTRRKKNGPVQPILLIIDELDRCRPDYAIRMLERIKHYFDVPGVTFLIATDRGNLPSAVRTVYGAHVEGELYLRKFFDYEFHLSAPCSSTYAKHVIVKHVLPNVDPLERKAIRSFPCYFSNLDSLMDAAPRANLNKREYLEHFPAMVSAMNLSLRDTGQALTMLAAFVHSRGEGSAIIPIVDCFVSCLRFGHPAGFRLLIEDSEFYSQSNTDPQWLQDIYNRLARTEQWAGLMAFFNENKDIMRAFLSHGNGYEVEEPQRWQKVLGVLERDAITGPEKCYQAITAIRVRDADNTDPWSYAREFVRLTPPIIPNTALTS